jgi:hypothetical protein
MKTFYTVRDIEDMHAAGVAEIELHDDVVLTDVARERAIALGMRLRAAEAEDGGRRGEAKPRGSTVSQRVITSVVAAALPQPSPGPTAAASRLPGGTAAAPGDLVRKIKAAVVARLGTDKYNDVLDRIIPQVMEQIKK